MVMLFKRTKELEAQMDEYLDLVERGSLLFRQGLKYYLEQRSDEFRQRLEDLRNMESKADSLRRQIENRLYVHTLIPESRGDVLGLLESTDRILNKSDETLREFWLQKPKIDEKLHLYFNELAEAAGNAVEQMIRAIRAYFRNTEEVRDYISKVLFFEKEADKISEKIKKLVFESEEHLSIKLHLRDFVMNIDAIADGAEDVCDRLAIAAIKRQG
ncbi:MAG: DUF47 family protein [Calditrichia bacterium]